MTKTPTSVKDTHRPRLLYMQTVFCTISKSHDDKFAQQVCSCICPGPIERQSPPRECEEIVNVSLDHLEAHKHVFSIKGKIKLISNTFSEKFTLDSGRGGQSFFFANF